MTTDVSRGQAPSAGRIRSSDGAIAEPINGAPVAKHKWQTPVMITSLDPGLSTNKTIIPFTSQLHSHGSVASGSFCPPRLGDPPASGLGFRAAANAAALAPWGRTGAEPEPSPEVETPTLF